MVSCAGAPMSIGTLIGPTLVGAIVDSTGSYLAAFWTSAALVLTSVPVVLLAAWMAWKTQNVSETQKNEVEV